MRMVKLKHPDVEGTFDAPESAVKHYKRSGWTEANGEATEKSHPANTASTDSADVRPVVGNEAPAPLGGKNNVSGRRPTTEGNA